MKKFIFIMFAVVLLSSCKKEKEWIVIDCLGNAISSYRGSENEVKELCRQNSTPTCTWSYRQQ